MRKVIMYYVAVEAVQLKYINAIIYNCNLVSIINFETVWIEF